MKIVYCIQGTYNSGGMERVLANKANWLANRGYDITILTTEQKGRSPFYHYDNRVKHIDFGINYWDNTARSLLLKIPYYFLNKWKHRRLLSRFLMREKADIVISMFAHDMAHLTKINDGSKKILEYHFTKQRMLQMKRSGLRGLIDTVTFNKVNHLIREYDKFVVLTDSDKKNWGGATISIPNAVTFTSCKTAHLKNKKVVAVGRLAHEKGFDRLIDVWELFYKSHPNWTLEIIGEGQLRHSLENTINTRKLQDSIVISGAISDIQGKYEESSVLLMTSRHEGLGMVLIEAQSCGVPVIAYDVPCGPAEIIHNGEDGFLIKDGDVEDFVAKLSHLATNEELRQKMGDAAYRNAQRYSEDAIMAKWESLFHELIGK